MVNYLADVLPYTRRFSKPVCWNCETPYPTLNYLLWPRRCANCGKRRKARTWIVEPVLIFTAVWLWLNPDGRLNFGFGLIVAAYFVLVVVMDFEHHVVLHPVSWAGAALGLALGVSLHGFLATLTGGAAGFGLMWGAYLLGGVFTRLVVKRRGGPVEEVALGFGDVNLAGVLGLMLGWPGIVAGLVLGILAGGVFSLLFIFVLIMAGKYQAFSAIPYTPFLVFAAASLLFF